MSSLLVKRFSFLSPSSLSRHNHHLIGLNLVFPLLHFSLSTQTQIQPHPQKELPFIAQHLIFSFGFSLDRALKYSSNKNLVAIRSPDRPETVIKFLKDTGLSDSQIKAAVSFHPILLAYNVEKALKPKVRELMQNGFSPELLVQLIRCNPVTLVLKGTLSQLLFWRDFVGNCEENLLKIVKNTLLISLDIDKHITPRINLFKEYEFSSRDIMAVLGQGSGYMTRSLDFIRKRLDLIEELGISRGSKMFLCAFKAVGGFSRDNILKKVKFFTVTYGWSEDEVTAAFKKSPNILAISEEKLKSNMGFLISNAKLDPSSIALNPVILSYSLEKRMAPRHHVLSILQAKGLKMKRSFLSTCHMSERDFLDKFVLAYRESVPEVAEAYPGNLPIC